MVLFGFALVWVGLGLFSLLLVRKGYQQDRLAAGLGRADVAFIRQSPATVEDGRREAQGVSYPAEVRIRVWEDDETFI